jgi:hypothetical protein
MATEREQIYREAIRKVYGAGLTEEEVTDLYDRYHEGDLPRSRIEAIYALAQQVLTGSPVTGDKAKPCKCTEVTNPPCIYCAAATLD